MVGLFAAAIDCEIGGGFSESVKLHKLPTQIRFHLLYDAARRGRTSYGHTHATGDRALFATPARCGV